jgi:cytochrome oxidase assembly protein ShyY1
VDADTRPIRQKRDAYRWQVLKTAIWTLRQRRYAAMAALMLVVAVICIIAGTWQISRFNESVHDNDALDGNAHAATAPLTTGLVPLTGTAATPGRDAIRYRTVSATGTYLAGNQQLVVNQTLNNAVGFYVVDPLRTSEGVLLVVRGFVAQNADGTPPAKITAPPSGTVVVTGRLQTASTTHDDAGQPGPGLIVSVNPTEQAARLGQPIYNAYLSLNSGQPGSSGVTALPEPDLSNPAGGAYEAQHFAYIIQWYLFALLALAAPFVISRHEVHEARKQYLGLDPGAEELGLDEGPEPARAQLAAGSSPDGTLAVREGGGVAHYAGPSEQEWQRAAELADRYGRSLGRERPAGLRGQRLGGRSARGARTRGGLANSANGVHRSDDAHHGAYNDYLWEIALSDGATPDVSLRPEPVDRSAPRVIDGTPAGPSDADDAR